MALLTRKTTASTLPEAVVASLIWLLFFFLTLNVLVYAGASQTDEGDLLVAGTELLACRDEAEQLAENETVTRGYEWGEILLRKEEYGETTVLISLKAIVGKSKREVGYHYLMPKAEQGAVPEANKK